MLSVRSLAKKKALMESWALFLYGGRGRSRTGLDGFAIHCITALLPGQSGSRDGPQIKKPRSFCRGFFGIWSGKRDSNSRPQPWQGCALPTELFPLHKKRIFYSAHVGCQAFHPFLLCSSSVRIGIAALRYNTIDQSVNAAAIYSIITPMETVCSGPIGV